jgi:ubiquinone/menaquinone biosynthesis C-methylase UbiE
VPGVAGSLPFADQSFDAAMAVSTDQHWPDVIAGYREMQRVARRACWRPISTPWRSPYRPCCSASARWRPTDSLPAA